MTSGRPLVVNPPIAREIDWSAERLRGVGRLAAWSCWLGAMVSAAGLTLGDASILALASAILGAAFCLFDISKADRGGITPITFYSFSSALTGLANFVGLRALDTPRQSLYFIYTSFDDLFVASILAWAATILPVLGFWAVSRAGALAGLLAMMPRVRGYIPHRHLLIGGTALALASIITRLIAPLDWLGTLGYFFHLMPHFVAFALARAGAQRRDRLATGAALAVAVIEGTRALLFAFLRTDILLPFVAFTFGHVLGRRSLRALFSPAMVPIWVFGLVFITYFGAFGLVRGQSAGGVARLLEVQDVQESYPGELAAVPRQTVLSRLTSFNQLSQIGRMTRQRGLLGGETFEYLGFALVPRFLWPEKPLIAKGAWFALEIGQAHIRPDGRISNSVNMTVAGELYLNFGWTGVLLGAPVFGAFLALLWMTTTFWRDERNVLGGAFAFYLIWIGFGLGADLQILVTLLAMYLLFVVASAALGAGLRNTLQQRDGITGP